MTKGITQVEVRTKRGHVVVQARGATPRGQKYLGDSVTLSVSKFDDKKFKGELAAAVDELFA